MGKILLTRKNSFFGMFAKYKIFIDGKEVGKINNKEQIELDIPDGNHEVYLKNAVISTGKSNTISFDSKNTSITNILVKSGYYNLSGIKLELKTSINN